ncbi:MAG: SpoIIE family protein phosphatase [Lachnospiraceae bacterium]|nr:SpoIIE family protein phosphatase [Lachnospiraceae bacterium]
MFAMILKMSVLVILYLALVAITWYLTKDKEKTLMVKIVTGIVFGISSILSTHFGVIYDDMILNVRDIGPLAAGLFFSPLSGVIAGLMGGIERYIAGTYFGVSSFTSVACSVSTCLAGFVAWIMNAKVFKGKKPSPAYAFFMGSIMEVFHMYVVFITHRDDMNMAFLVVRTCAIPMIIFTGLGMAMASVMLQVFIGEWRNPFIKRQNEEIPVSQKFQKWLFFVTFAVIVGNFLFVFSLQTASFSQHAVSTVESTASFIQGGYLAGNKELSTDNDVLFSMIDENGKVVKGSHTGTVLERSTYEDLKDMMDKDVFTAQIFEEKSYNKVMTLYDGKMLLVFLNSNQVFWYRNAQAYENGLANLMLFTVIYVLIAWLVNMIVVRNIKLINESLGKITNGDLSEHVEVRNSSEFASLSDDINQTVDTLKSYIDAAEKRIEQELILARTIQESALPQNFEFSGRKDFEIHATMKAAKTVGGDFYDFFFADKNKIALVIADVSGKGIPASLFMMKSKTAIRGFAESGDSPSEILYKANNVLCDGNDAMMFVTAWIGILDLDTGDMKCANAGHEFPVIRRAGGSYELFKEPHSLPLGAMEEIRGEEYYLHLDPEDILFVYTDGVPEAQDLDNVQYGTDRLLSVLNGTEGYTMAERLKAVDDDIALFKGKADQFDDITMLGFKINQR